MSPRIEITRRLRRQGERYFADGLRELPENRRLAILAVCAVEWEMFLADAVVETHDRTVGRTYRTAVRTCEAQLGDETAAVREALRSFADLGSALIGARDTGAGTRRGDREPSRMGGSRRPRRNGWRPGEHGRVGSVEPCVGGLQPLPALHAAHAAHAGHRGVARGQALTGCP